MRKSDRTCSYEGCDRKHASKGFCGMHYQRWRNGKDMALPPRKLYPGQICKLDGCDEPFRGMGYCNRHYQQFKRGDPITLRYNGNDRRPCNIHRCTRVRAAKATFCQRHQKIQYIYGLSTEMMIHLYFTQRCHACGSAEDLGVDHDHSCCPDNKKKKCGQCNRGLLCHSCNLALGMVQDSPKRLIQLAHYLERKSKI